MRKEDIGGRDTLNAFFTILCPLTAVADTVNTVYFFLLYLIQLRIHPKNHLYFPFSLPVQSKDDQIQVIGNLKNISMASSKLLLAAKSLSVDPGAANAKNLLAVAARCDMMQIAPDMYQIFCSVVSNGSYGICK